MAPVTGTLRKAALLVTALDTQSADLLLEQLPAEHAERVRNAVMQLDKVDEAEQEQVVREFLQRSPKAAASAGVELHVAATRQTADGAAMPSSASAPSSARSQPFKLLNEVEPEELVRVLAPQHPQISAVVLAHLTPKQAADVLHHFPTERQVDVLRRIAQLEDTQPEVVQELERELESLFAGVLRTPRQAGLEAVRKILEATDDPRRQTVWQSLQQCDRHLANQLTPLLRRGLAQRSAEPPTYSEQAPQVENAHEAAGQRAPQRQSLSEPSWTFDEVMNLSDTDLALLLQRADPTDVLLALAGAEPAFVRRLKRSLPAKLARQLERNLQQLQPLWLPDVEAAQRHLVQLARQLSQQRVLATDAA